MVINSQAEQKTPLLSQLFKIEPKARKVKILKESKLKVAGISMLTRKLSINVSFEMPNNNEFCLLRGV